MRLFVVMYQNASLDKIMTAVVMAHNAADARKAIPGKVLSIAEAAQNYIIMDTYYMM